MSVRSKSEKGIKDVMKEFYESWEKTAAEQLMKVARNQVFLSAIAQNIERTLNISGRVKEVTQTTMAMMSLPTKQDIDNLTKQIRLMRAALDEVTEKIDILAATALSPVAAANAAASMAATIAEVSDLGGFEPDLTFEEPATKSTKSGGANKSAAKKAVTTKATAKKASAPAKSTKKTNFQSASSDVAPKPPRRKGLIRRKPAASKAE
jgi:uncharacterized protein (DUF885 family)